MARAYTVMSSFARQLAQQDAQTGLLMAERWRYVEARLMGYMDSLAREAIETGVRTPSQLYRMYRYQELIGIANTEAAGFEAWATDRITFGQRQAVDLGLRAAVMEVYGDRFFAPAPNMAAIANMIGLCADGQPLFSLLAGRAIAPDAVQGLTDRLLESLALGYNPRKTARLMADGLTGGLQKALVISRTEQVRAYREANRAQYEAMGVTRYQRHCAKSDRTCPACLALDGKIYDTREMMESHPQCRCFMVAVIPGMEHETARAQDWFANLDEKRQRGILGNARFELYREGVPLEKMVRVRQDPTWGPTVGVRSAADIRGDS